MALGTWTSEKQKDLFVAASDVPRSPGHHFFVALNKLLAEAKFDAYVEGLCEPRFLGLLPTQSSPEHSSLTVIRKRLPKELIEQVFAFVLKLAFDKRIGNTSSVSPASGAESPRCQVILGAQAPQLRSSTR